MKKNSFFLLFNFDGSISSKFLMNFIVVRSSKSIALTLQNYLFRYTSPSLIILLIKDQNYQFPVRRAATISSLDLLIGIFYVINLSNCFLSSDNRVGTISHSLYSWGKVTIFHFLYFFLHWCLHHLWILTTGLTVKKNFLTIVSSLTMFSK